MASRASSKLLEVGRVAKVHGIRGEVIVSLFTSRVERVAAGSILYPASRGGRASRERAVVATNDAGGASYTTAYGRKSDDTLPDSLVVKRSRFTGCNGYAGRWIVAFDGVDSRTYAERLVGAVLTALSVENPGGLWVDDLAGCTVYDTTGRVAGKVAAMLVYPGGDLLELEDGKMVPLAFVVSHEAGRVVVDVPEGLL
ncbi:MAG: hypothetical protein M1399_02915 [Actinobacteria bacterium]|nr:hypothetical protein [Actinomycetota bacterium]MCL5446360.1 hypothetical protein [Actinomycetota bacterium]